MLSLSHSPAFYIDNKSLIQRSVTPPFSTLHCLKPDTDIIEESRQAFASISVTPKFHHAKSHQDLSGTPVHDISTSVQLYCSHHQASCLPACSVVMKAHQHGIRSWQEGEDQVDWPIHLIWLISPFIELLPPLFVAIFLHSRRGDKMRISMHSRPLSPLLLWFVYHKDPCLDTLATGIYSLPLCWLE